MEEYFFRSLSATKLQKIVDTTKFLLNYLQLFLKKRIFFVNFLKIQQFHYLFCNIFRISGYQDVRPRAVL